MAYCKDPKNHRTAWWSSSGFEWFDYRRKKIVPSKTASVICQICHCHWGTTNRELVAKLPSQRPNCTGPHDWTYNEAYTLRQCQRCGTEQLKSEVDKGTQ